MVYDPGCPQEGGNRSLEGGPGGKALYFLHPVNFRVLKCKMTSAIIETSLKRQTLFRTEFHETLNPETIETLNVTFKPSQHPLETETM